MGNPRGETEQPLVTAHKTRSPNGRTRSRFRAADRIDHTGRDIKRTTVTVRGRARSNEHQRTVEGDDETPEHRPYDDPDPITPRRKRSGLFCTASSPPSLGRRLRRRPSEGGRGLRPLCDESQSPRSGPCAGVHLLWITPHIPKRIGSGRRIPPDTMSGLPGRPLGVRPTPL